MSRIPCLTFDCGIRRTRTDGALSAVVIHGARQASMGTFMTVTRPGLAGPRRPNSSARARGSHDEDGLAIHVEAGEALGITQLVLSNSKQAAAPDPLYCVIGVEVEFEK